jgi:hypothetical protein
MASEMDFDQCEFELTEAVNSLRGAHDRAQKQMSTAMAMYALAALVCFYIKQDPISFSLFNDLEIKREHAYVFLTFIGSLLLFARSFSLLFIRMLYVHINRLYRAEFGVAAPTWSFFRAGWETSNNRLQHFGIFGGALKYLFWAVPFSPALLILIHELVDKRYLIILAVIPAILALVNEVFFGRVQRVVLMLERTYRSGKYDV